jgi:RNA polymerase sigma-70 factor (ECF subfamily)
MKSETQLIEEILSYEKQIFIFCFNLLKHNKQSAEDLTQDTLQKAFVNLNKITSDEHLKSWLYTIARNTFINNYRKTKNKKVLFIGDAFDYKSTTSIPDNFDSIQEKESNVDFILAQLKRIKPKYKECMQLHIDGNKIEEIAVKLNIPSGTVKSRIFKGRQQMKENIKPIMQYIQFDIRD